MKTITTKEIQELEHAGRAVIIYPRKKQVVVDGFKYYKLINNTTSQKHR